MAQKKKSDALEILRKRFAQDDPNYEVSLEEERANLDIARQIQTLRKKSGMTQKMLADRVGTSTSVISRLEDADYDGHSMAMLRRIAAALGKEVRVSFVSTSK